MREARLRELLTLSHWDQLDPPTQEEAVYAVASHLPEPFRFDGLEVHELGQQRHRVAFFMWKEARFALIPGGPATLGYAPGSFHPTEAQVQSWEETRRNWPDIALKYPTLEILLEEDLTPLRQVTLQPFLLEVVATDLNPPAKTQEGWVYIFPGPQVSYTQTQKHISQDGFRFPTSDEWEYACAAGARTLWRWGDDTPMVRRAEWELHLRPNAFGLLIGDNPFKMEFTAEMGVLRGGDGGTIASVALGKLLEWLTLASSFPGLHMRVPRSKIHSAHLRRAYPLFG